MKVIIAGILALASASALRSGPYLPSGWRPDGPAFYLPSEVSKPSKNPLKDTILQESEAAGSDFLREYGPPKLQEISEDITKQELPEVITEQAFVVIDAKFNQENIKQEENIEVAVKEGEESLVAKLQEEVTETIVEAATEGIAGEKYTETVTSSEEIVIDITTEAAESQPLIFGKSLNVEIPAVEVTTTPEDKESTAEVSESIVEINESTEVNTPTEGIIRIEPEDSNSDVVVSVEKQIVEQNVEGVKSIVEALVNLENQIKTDQVQSVQDVIEVNTVQEGSGLEQAPEGFLEYGPPGFREYGPPKEDELLRTAVVETSSGNEFADSNETRRRRYSPRFRSAERRI